MAAPQIDEDPVPVAAAAGGSGGDGPRRPFVTPPALQQAIRLLQLSRLELIAEIRAELDAERPSDGVTCSTSP